MDGSWTPSRKGGIAEAAIISAALRLGVDVYRPVAEGGRCDLIFDVGAQILRVQCKWARREGDVLRVLAHTSCRQTGGGHIRRGYDAADIDALVAYSPDTDRCYLIP